MAERHPRSLHFGYHRRIQSALYRNGRCGSGISIATIGIAKFGREPPVANQLFRVLPSSENMGAANKEDKIDSGSQFGKKGACQWNHSSQPSCRLAAPGQHVCLSDALQFLIANPELEFDLSPKRISKLKISNRKYMTNFQSENWAASEFRRLPQANCWKKSARSPQFLIATEDPTRIGILSDQRESKELSWDPAKIARTVEAANFLIATLPISEIESTCGKQTAKQISNSNKNAVSAFSTLRDAARVTGSSHA